MPGPGGREVGRVSVRALPDTSSFGRSLERYLQRLERTLRVEIPVDVNDGDIAAAEATLDEVARDRTVSLNVDVDRSALDRLEGVLGGIAGGAGGGGIPLPSASNLNPSKLAVLAAALAAVAPLIGTLVLALPSMVTAIAAPLAAVLIGLEGITRAAQVLVAPFKTMQAIVSATFEKRLLPIFQELKKIFQPLALGMVAVTNGLIDMFGAVVDGLTSVDGLDRISNIFTSIGDAFSIIAPSLEPLTDAFLRLIEEGAAAFERAAPQFAKLNEIFSNFVTWADDSGVLADAFDLLSATIEAFLFSLLLFVAVTTTAAAGIKNQLEFWASLPRRIGEKIGETADSIANAPATILGAAQDAALGLFNAGFGLIDSFLDGIAVGAGFVVAFFIGLPGMVLTAVGDLSEVLINAGEALIGGLITGIGNKFDDVKGVLEGLTGVIPQWKGPPVHDATILRPAGRLIIDGLIDGLESRFADVQASLAGLTGGLMPAAAGGASFLPSDFGSSAGSSRKGITITNWRDGTGYMEEIADSRVGASDGWSGQVERAFG